MRARRVVLIESMFRSIATSREMQIIDNLYQKNLKAAAIVKMLRKIQVRWFEMLEDQRYRPPKTSIFNRKRNIVINSGGTSNIESW